MLLMTPFSMKSILRSSNARQEHDGGVTRPNDHSHQAAAYLSMEQLVSFQSKTSLKHS